MTDRNHNLKLRHQGSFLLVNVPPDVRHAFPSSNGKPRERIIDSLVWGLSVSRKKSPRIESFCHVMRWHCRTAALLLGCAERSQPRSRVRRAEGAGLDRECADPVTMSLPRRTNDFYFVGSPSIAEDIAAAVEHSRRRSGFSSIATDSVIQEEVGWEIDDFAKRHGITLAPGTQPWRQLGLAFMQAYASDRHRDAVEAMGEIPTLTVAPGATEAAAAAPPPVRLGGGTPFSVTAAKYLEEMQCDKSARLRESTYAQYETTFRLFRDFSEDRPLSTVDHKTASEFLDAVAKLDSIWGKGADAKTRTLAQLLELFGGATGRPKLSNQSINRHCRALKALYKWAQLRGDVDIDRRNPFADRHRKRGKANGWQPYTVDELNKLFAAPLFQVPRAERIRPKKFGLDNALRWAPLIALVTGMRIEECCQLQVADLKRESVIWYFNVVEGADQSLKTENAVRRVPVHDELVALGLLDYAKRLPEDGPLLPSLPKTRLDSKSSAEVSRKFGQFKSKAGVTRARLSFDRVGR